MDTWSAASLFFLVLSPATPPPALSPALAAGAPALRLTFDGGGARAVGPRRDERQRAPQLYRSRRTPADAPLLRKQSLATLVAVAVAAKSSALAPGGPAASPPRKSKRASKKRLAKVDLPTSPERKKEAAGFASLTGATAVSLGTVAAASTTEQPPRAKSPGSYAGVVKSRDESTEGERVFQQAAPPASLPAAAATPAKTSARPATESLKRGAAEPTAEAASNCAAGGPAAVPAAGGPAAATTSSPASGDVPAKSALRRRSDSGLSHSVLPAASGAAPRQRSEAGVDEPQPRLNRGSESGLERGPVPGATARPMCERNGCGKCPPMSDTVFWAMFSEQLQRVPLVGAIVRSWFASPRLPLCAAAARVDMQQLDHIKQLSGTTIWAIRMQLLLLLALLCSPERERQRRVLAWAAGHWFRTGICPSYFAPLARAWRCVASSDPCAARHILSFLDDDAGSPLQLSLDLRLTLARHADDEIGNQDLVRRIPRAWSRLRRAAHEAAAAAAAGAKAAAAGPLCGAADGGVGGGAADSVHGGAATVGDVTVGAVAVGVSAVFAAGNGDDVAVADASDPSNALDGAACVVAAFDIVKGDLRSCELGDVPDFSSAPSVTDAIGGGARPLLQSELDALLRCAIRDFSRVVTKAPSRPLGESLSNWEPGAIKRFYDELVLKAPSEVVVTETLRHRLYPLLQLYVSTQPSYVLDYRVSPWPVFAEAAAYGGLRQPMRRPRSVFANSPGSPVNVLFSTKPFSFMGFDHFSSALRDFMNCRLAREDFDSLPPLVLASDTHFLADAREAQALGLGVAFISRCFDKEQTERGTTYRELATSGGRYIPPIHERPVKLVLFMVPTEVSEAQLSAFIHSLYTPQFIWRRPPRLRVNRPLSSKPPAKSRSVAGGKPRCPNLASPAVANNAAPSNRWPVGPPPLPPANALAVASSPVFSGELGSRFPGSGFGGSGFAGPRLAVSGLSGYTLAPAVVFPLVVAVVPPEAQPRYYVQSVAQQRPQLPEEHPGDRVPLGISGPVDAPPGSVERTKDASE